MHVQEKRLIRLIEASSDATPALLASEFGVGERTIRTYIRRANELLGSAAHIEKRYGDGYGLVIDDERAYAAFKDAMDAPERPNTVPATPEERVAYLINDLVSRTTWITLDDLSAILFVSRSAISNDLREVERRLAQYSLTLEKRPRYGIRVSGSELNRRICLAASAMESASGVGRDISTGSTKLEGLEILGRDSAERAVLVKGVAEAVDDALAKQEFIVNSVAYQNLILHVSIAIMRIRAACYVPMETGSLERIHQTPEFEVARGVAIEISERFDIELPEEEVAYIAIHLAGKQTFAPVMDDKAGLVISDEVWQVALRMIERVWNVSRFDFRNDLELRMNLARHIVPLSVRMRYNMKLSNPLLSDIKARYSLAYTMAVDACTVLVEHYGAAMTDDEIGYVALAFALALERQKTELPKKRILVVCASGAGSARLLEYRCRQEFGSYIEDVESCDVMNLSKVDFSRIDYVFTTVPIADPLPVPVREVQHFLDANEVEGIRGFLLDNAYGHGSILSHFDRDLFFTHLPFKTKHEVLEFLLDKTVKAKGLSEHFHELVWKRESTVATSFGNNVAMPHPMEGMGSETFVCVGLLDEPVLWDHLGQTAQAVFLSVFASNGGLELQSFYGHLADLLISKSAIQTLLDDQRWETLVSLLAALQGPDADRGLGSGQS